MDNRYLWKVSSSQHLETYYAITSSQTAPTTEGTQWTRLTTEALVIVDEGGLDSNTDQRQRIVMPVLQRKLLEQSPFVDLIAKNPLFFQLVANLPLEGTKDDIDKFVQWLGLIVTDLHNAEQSVEQIEEQLEIVRR